MLFKRGGPHRRILFTRHGVQGFSTENEKPTPVAPSENQGPGNVSPQDPLPQKKS